MKAILWMAVFFASLTMQAQDELFRKYTDMDDITTRTVGKESLVNLPLDQFNVPGLKNMVDRIEMMTILISTGNKAGKKLGTKLPKQLSGKGFKTVLNTKQDGRDLTVMQSKKDPSRGQLKGEGFKVMQETKINEQNVTVMQSKKDPSKVAIIVYQKPQATAVYMKGNFEDLESDFSGLIQ